MFLIKYNECDFGFVEVAEAVNKELCLKIHDADSGCVSDIDITSAKGIPMLNGLSVSGLPSTAANFRARLFAEKDHARNVIDAEDWKVLRLSN